MNQKIAYRHHTREILCPDCAKEECIAEMCQPSQKMLKVGN